MKRVIKKFNVFAIAAMIVAGGLTLAFKAPSEKSTNIALTEYGRQADGTWVAVGMASPGTGAGQYTCEISDKVCRAFFDSQPAPNEQPEQQNILEPDGDFLLH